MKIGFYKRENGAYQVSYRAADNKRVRKQFKSHRAAKIYAANVTKERSPLLLPAESSKSVSGLLEEYLEQIPESTIKKRGFEVLKSFKTYFENVHCRDLNKVICGHWIESVRLKFGYSSRTMRITKYAYSKFFADLMGKNLITRNYLADVPIRLGTRTKNRVFLSESELVEILNGLKRLSPETIFPVVYFLIHTGCKISETLALKWTDLNLETRTVSFPRSPMANARTLNLSSHILELLRSRPKLGDHVFLNAQGCTWTVKNYYRAMVLDRNAIGHPRHWDSFSFRHTFAYHFLRTGKTLHQLQVVIGHRNIADTIKAYGDII